MHTIPAIFISLLLFLFAGCEEKKTKDAYIPVENTTEFVSTEEKRLSNCEKQFKIERNHNNTNSTIPSSPPLNIPDPIKGSNTFMLLDTKSKSQKVTVLPGQTRFHHNNKPIVIVNFFASWCPPCIDQFSAFNRLHKIYRNDLLLLGILTHDTIQINALKSFIAKHEIHYFISSSPHNNAFSTHIANILQLPENFSIPLTVIYVNGKYFTHYEGIVPVEMIEYDIKQAKKQLKSNKNKAI